MSHYFLAAQEFYFAFHIPELEAFAINNGVAVEAAPFISSEFRESELISRLKGWVANAHRLLEVYDVPSGILLKVEGGGEFLIAGHGKTIGKSDPKTELSRLDREVILGPGLVLALALRGVWSFHASAVMYKESLIIFLGESGQGKSTLAAYLSQSPGWRLVADDILPVSMDTNGVNVFPHFPQLKMPVDAQPSVGLPESLPLKHICILTPAATDEMPELQITSTAQTVQAFLGHVAGTRMFNALLLSRHLEFSTRAAKQVSAYRLAYPHRPEVLPIIRDFLEKIC